MKILLSMVSGKINTGATLTLCLLRSLSAVTSSETTVWPPQTHTARATLGPYFCSLIISNLPADNRKCYEKNNKHIQTANYNSRPLIPQIPTLSPQKQDSTTTQKQHYHKKEDSHLCQLPLLGCGKGHSKHYLNLPHNPKWWNKPRNSEITFIWY